MNFKKLCVWLCALKERRERSKKVDRACEGNTTCRQGAEAQAVLVGGRGQDDKSHQLCSSCRPAAGLQHP